MMLYTLLNYKIKPEILRKFYSVCHHCSYHEIAIWIKIDFFENCSRHRSIGYNSPVWRFLSFSSVPREQQSSGHTKFHSLSVATKQCFPSSPKSISQGFGGAHYESDFKFKESDVLGRLFDTQIHARLDSITVPDACLVTRLITEVSGVNWSAQCCGKNDEAGHATKLA